MVSFLVLAASIIAILLSSLKIYVGNEATSSMPTTSKDLHGKNSARWMNREALSLPVCKVQEHCIKR
ncbi:hypothetical protein NC652_013985 [Populus alba x Populus x berolinensis]|nr:hypothetical protein NC652_013985 [Populus alba x Populus x berolinensis]